MRWLFVAQDGWGLGHVSRQLGLARQLRRVRPRDEMLFLTYSDATHLIAAEGFASVKLPPSQPHKPPGEQMLPPASRLAVATALVRSLASAYRPHGLVVDTFPIGLFGELAVLLDLQGFKFLIAREVRNAPPQWRYQESLPRFDALLAPYVTGEIELDLPAGTPAHFVGPILVRGREDLLPRQAARQRLGLPQQGPVCLVSFGGGGNPAYGRLEQWILQAAERHPAWHFAFARPPLLQGRGGQLAPRNASCFSYYPMAECCAAFDTAISTTGSSAYELAAMGVPAILLPSTSPQQVEDHRHKAERVLGAGGGFVVAAYDTPGLEAALAAMSDPARLAAMRDDRARLCLPNGAERAAAVITEVVDDAP